MKILKYFKPIYLLYTAIIIVLVYFQVQFDLKIPEYLSSVVNGITLSSIAMNEILWIGCKMLILAVCSAIMTGIVGYLASIIASGYSRRLRHGLFTHIEGLSMAEINKFSTASLITRTTNDIQQLQQVITMVLRMAVTAPIMAVGAILKIVDTSKELSIATIIAISVMLVVIVLLFSLVVPKFKVIQKQTDKLNSVSRENLTGLRVIRAYNTEDKEEQKFDKVNKELSKTYLFINNISVMLMPSMQIIMNGLTLTIVWLGAYLIAGNSLNIGDLMAFSSYAMQILMSFIMLTMLFVMVPRGIVSANRVNEVLKTKSSINEPISPEINDENVQGSIEFKNVSFKYPDADDYVLEDISFKVNKGETIAFIGSTGSGKSTLINLIPRFYDVTNGEVLVDGINVKDYSTKELHSKLGYVPQKGNLFSGTIESNLKLAREDADEEAMHKALKISKADFVFKSEKKLKSPISQGGKNVSGGQKQRLSIARAVIKEPEIYIFDDSFSALDYKTDRDLRENLKKYTEKATSVIVAQRIGTILNADKIVVLENGKVVGIGKHKDLLKKCKTYKEIALSQLSEEELR